MKKLFSSLLLPALFASGLLWANETTLLDISQFQVQSFKSSLGSCSLPNPFGFLANGTYIGKAKLSKNKSQHLQYIDSQADCLYGFKVSSCSGFTLVLGGGMHGLLWNQNPYFSTKDFPFINVGIAGYTASIPDWFWQAGLNAQVEVDAHEKHVWGNYSRYSAMLWGRYSYCQNLGIHTGVLFWTGINKTTAWPIIGVDWTIDKHWQLNLIVPINLSLYYNFDECWSLSLAGRPFYSRHRVGSNQPVPEGIYDYRNYGAELSLNFSRCTLLWSVYAGYSFGQTLKIANRNNVPVNYQEFGAAPYVGLNLTWSF